MFGEIVNDRKTKILEQRWETLRGILQEFLDGPKELTARDLAHQILMSQQATDTALEAATIARKQYVEAYGEPDGDDENASMDSFMRDVAQKAADIILNTPTPEQKETP